MIHQIILLKTIHCHTVKHDHMNWFPIDITLWKIMTREKNHTTAEMSGSIALHCGVFRVH